MNVVCDSVNVLKEKIPHRLIFRCAHVLCIKDIFFELCPGKVLQYYDKQSLEVADPGFPDGGAKP